MLRYPVWCARGVNNTMLQLGFHMSGTAGDEDFYYLDMRSPDASTTANRVRINRVRNGSYTLLTGGKGR